MKRATANAIALLSFGAPLVAFLSTASCSSSPSGSGTVTAGDAPVNYPTYRALHADVVMPTCGPRNGVCHNSKQFPDMHTPENLLAAIGQRCNQLTSDPHQIVDLCEAKGDLLVLKSGDNAGWQSRVGFVTWNAGANELSLTLRDAPPSNGAGLDFSIVRDLAPSLTEELHVGSFLTTKAGDPSVTIDPTKLSPGLRSFLTSTYTPGLAAQIQLGDPNRNGVFGAELGGAVIKPGDPENSFLVQRILGKVKPAMPLANDALTNDQKYALQCWIQQLAPDGSNADGPIDYSRCPESF